MVCFRARHHVVTKSDSERRVGRLSVCGLRAECLRGRLRREAIAQRGECGCLVDAEAEDARRIAHRAAAAIGDLLAHHGGMLAAVLVVDILQHVLALAVREVDVDVGGLGAVFAEEALEQQAELDGVDGRDPECIADGGVCRGAAALAENSLAPREADDVPHDQEVAGEPELRDQRELVRELLLVHRRADRGVRRSPALVCPLGDEPLEVLILPDAGGQCEGGQRCLQLVEAKGATVRDVEGRAYAFRRMAPAPRDLGRALEVPFAVRPKARAHLVERQLVPQRGEDIVYHAILCARVMNVVRDDPWDVECARELDEVACGLVLLGQSMIPALDRDAPAEDVEQCRRCVACAVVIAAREEGRNPSARASGHREEALRMRRELIERDAR